MHPSLYNQIHFRAEFTIEEGKIEAFKKLIQDMSRVVEANEPDTINYKFYLNRAETKCIVDETYSNSEAALAHSIGIASQTILPKIFSVSRISRFDVYGNPSEELQKALTSVGPQTYNPFAGFSHRQFFLLVISPHQFLCVVSPVFLIIVHAFSSRQHAHLVEYLVKRCHLT